MPRLLIHATRCLLIALLVPTACTQHGPIEVDDVPDADAPELEARGQSEAEQGPGHAPQRCRGVVHEPRAIADDEGFDRGVLRVKTDTGLREIPLQETTFETTVVGTVAETQVTQVFANPFDAPIEAIYTFPLHEKAAVDDYWIHIGARSIHGSIMRRQAANEAYAQAKHEGRSAGLLEQERPNVFTQSVANIMPGESIEVQMHIVQPLGQQDGRYTLVLPTVVGPRFPGGVPDAARLNPPVLPVDTHTCSPVRVSVDIEAGFPIAGLASKTHAVEINAANDVATVELQDGVAVADRDFELSWDIVRESPQGALLVQRDQDGTGGYFTLTIEPPDAIRPDATVPRDLVFVVDNSGSMSGQPMDVAKQTVRTAVQGLHPDDTFQIMRFSETASGLSPTPLANTPANRARGIAYIDQMQGMGGTDMVEGIKAALSAKHGAGRMPIVVFLTDGYIGNEREIFAATMSRLGDARIFSVGVGSSPNRHLLDGLAMAGRGSTSYVGLQEDPGEAVDAFYERIAFPALSDVEIDWGDLAVHDVVPSRIPDLFVGQPIVVYGRIDGAPSGNVEIKGRLGTMDVTLSVAIDFAGRHASQGSGLASMWARTKIEELLRDPEFYALSEAAAQVRTDAATALALSHSVLTEETAFVAVDSKVVVNANGTQQTIEVPIESPQGMSRDALIGGSIGLGSTGRVAMGHGGGSGYGTGAAAGFGGKGTRVPQVRQAKATVTGSVDKDVIRRIVRSHINEVRHCYNQGLVVDPNLAGRLSVEFTIGPDGKVVTSVLADSTLGDPGGAVAACIVKAVKRWQFPKSAGDTVTVSYPFVLSPG